MPSLLAKPCQSGKTFELLSKTVKLIESNPSTIHLILTDNSLLQLEQIHKRILSETGYPTIVLNSDNNISTKNIERAICKSKIKYIVLCTNSTQMKKIDKLIKDMLTTKIPFCKGKLFYIWVDEGDKIDEIANVDMLDYWSNHRNVQQLCYITATPYSLIVRYDKLKVMKVKSIYNKKTYSKWSDCNVTTMKERSRPRSFIEDVFEIKEPKVGHIWFIAASHLCDEQNRIARLLNNYDMYVLTINTYGEILRTPDGDEINLGGYGPLSDRISSLYKRYQLRDKIFAINGYNRIGRGITIQSEGVLISHAIFASTPSSKASIYQLAGRICGNYKQYKKYKRPYVYCTKHFDKVAYESEDIIISIAKLPYVDIDKYEDIKDKAKYNFLKS